MFWFGVFAIYKSSLKEMSVCFMFNSKRKFRWDLLLCRACAQCSGHMIRITCLTLLCCLTDSFSMQHKALCHWEVFKAEYANV